MTSRVCDWMTKEVASLTPGMTLEQMDSVLVRRGVTGAPVLDRGRLVGVASQSDVVHALWAGQHEAARESGYYESPFLLPMSMLGKIAADGNHWMERMAKLTVRDIMSSDPSVAQPDDLVGTVAQRMVRQAIHRMPVVDPESGALIGIITSLDLLRAMAAASD